MVGPLFAQTGWANVTFTGGEVRNPGRNLPRALIGGTAMVVTLYLLANLAYAATLPLDAIQHAPQNRVATPRPTSLPSGIAPWLRTFASWAFDALPEGQREAAFAETVELLRATLCDSRGRWTADYTRLRFARTTS